MEKASPVRMMDILGRQTKGRLDPDKEAKPFELRDIHNKLEYYPHGTTRLYCSPISVSVFWHLLATKRNMNEPGIGSLDCRSVLAYVFRYNCFRTIDIEDLWFLGAVPKYSF